MTRPPEPGEEAEVDTGTVDRPAASGTPLEATRADEPLTGEPVTDVPHHEVPSDEAAWERAARAAAHDDAPLAGGTPTGAPDDAVAPPTRLVPRVAQVTPVAPADGDAGPDAAAGTADTSDVDAAGSALPRDDLRAFDVPDDLAPGPDHDSPDHESPTDESPTDDALDHDATDLDAPVPDERADGAHDAGALDGADGASPHDPAGPPPGPVTPDPAWADPGAPGPGPAAPAPVHVPGPAPSSGDAPPPEAWRTLGRSLRPRVNRAQVLAGLLCGMLGFAVVVQVRQTHDEGLSTLRQSELVGILDQTTRQGDELEREADSLERTRQKLLSGSTSSQAALDAAMSSAATQGILAGRLPAEGPGLTITVADPDGVVAARSLLNLLEELRNAGAEAVQLNDLRITASSYVVEGEGRGVVVDGVAVEPPYRWLVIGDPATMGNAMEIPGGAFPTIRNDGGRPTAVQQDELSILATRTIPEPRFATPLAPEEG